MFRVGGAEPEVGAISRAQLLATNIVDRLHDAVYVIPRAVDASEEAAMNLKEYAVDIAFSVKKLRQVADEFPTWTEANFRKALADVASDETNVDAEIKALLEDARKVRDKLD
jgi:hypothetical protein